MQTSQVNVEKVYLPTIGAPASEFVEQLNRWDDDAVSRGKGFLVSVEGGREPYRLMKAVEEDGFIRLDIKQLYRRGVRRRLKHASVRLPKDVRMPEIGRGHEIEIELTDAKGKHVVIYERYVTTPKMTMVERRAQAKARRLAAERAREEAFADAEVRKDRPLLLEWKTITRERLEQLVWTYPVQTVAYMAGVTDTAVGKKCDARAIATPWRGFWREVEQGYRLHPGGVPQRPPKGEEWRYREYARVALGKKKQVKRVRR